MHTQDVDQKVNKIVTIFIRKIDPYNERIGLLLYNGSEKNDSGTQIIHGDVS